MKRKQRKIVPIKIVEEIREAYSLNDFSSPRLYKNRYNRKGKSYRELAQEYGYSLSTITKIIQGRY